MHASSRKRQQLVGLFLLGCLAFNYPIVTIFDRPAMVFGVPLLYAYLFGAWALLILVVAVIVGRRD